jgi:hypothetical protein
MVSKRTALIISICSTFFFIFLAMVTSAWADMTRPGEGKGPTEVYVAIYVMDVDEIDSAGQKFVANLFLHYRWHDRRQAHGGSNKITRSLVDVWHPRLQLANQQKLWSTFSENVEISTDGEVLYRQRVWGSFSQPLTLNHFPFDQHFFHIQLAAAGYGPEEVALLADPDKPGGISKKLSVADWRVLDWKLGPKAFPRPGLEPVAGFTFTFEADRETGYFIWKVIVPLILIVAMSWIVFWIDPAEKGTQINVAITAMLTLIAYRFAIGSTLPKISYLTQLDKFILASTLLVFASIVEVIITYILASHEKLAQARALDNWARWLFPAGFALVVLATLFFKI